jgi:hypothetical protein
MKMKMIIKRFILKAFEANALSKVAWLLIREANKPNQVISRCGTRSWLDRCITFYFYSSVDEKFKGFH